MQALFLDRSGEVGGGRWESGTVAVTQAVAVSAEVVLC